MSDFGIKISQVGHDVKTALKENLVYTSKYDTLKLFRSGSGSQLVPMADVGLFIPGEALVTIAHNLGYKPAFMVFCSGAWRTTADLSPYSYRGVGAISPDGGSYSVDDTNLYIQLYNGSVSDKTINYRYHIYYNELV